VGELKRYGAITIEHVEYLLKRSAQGVKKYQDDIVELRMVSCAISWKKRQRGRYRKL